MRVTKKKTARNKVARGLFKSAVKKTREAILAGSKEETQKWLKIAVKSIDKAAQKGIIKKNAAARKKSRLNKLVKSLEKK